MALDNFNAEVIHGFRFQPLAVEKKLKMTALVQKISRKRSVSKNSSKNCLKYQFIMSFCNGGIHDEKALDI